MRHFRGQLAFAGVLTTALFFAGCSRNSEQQQLQQPSTSASATPGGDASQAPAATPQSAPPGQAAPVQRASNSTTARPPAQSGGRASSQPPASTGWGSTPGKAQPTAPTPPPPPREFTVAAGTSIPVRTITALSTKTARDGDRFEATLTKDLVVDDYLVAPRGASVTGVVTNSDPGGKVKGLASISVALTSIAGANGPIAVQTASVGQQAKSTKKKDAAKIGIGAGIGAAIGAIAGGGKGAAIGAGIGGAGGTGMVMMTKGDAAVIPSESVLTFRLSAPVTVTEKK